VDGVELCRGSVVDPAVVGAALEGSDAVVHLAALGSVPRSVEDPVGTHLANATGTLTVLEAARREGQHVIVAGSSSVYGANPQLPKHEELAVAPISPYAVTKLATEWYALAYQACYGLPVLAFRFFNVFGPLQAADHAYAAVVPSFVDAALAGRPVTVHGDGEQTRDFTYVGSVVGVIADALSRRVVAPGPVNLAYGTRRSLVAVLDELGDVLGHRVKREHGPPRAGDVRHSQAASGRLDALFPDAEAVDFRRGLEETVRWFSTGEVTVTRC
jgi:UDP-glucose 4-epimerase